MLAGIRLSWITMTMPQFGQQYTSPEYLQEPLPAPRSYIAAALLAFFLGEFGVHNFYLGYRQRAIIQLVIAIVGYALSIVLIGIPIVIDVKIWAFVEFVMILLRSGTYATDPYGRELI